MSRARRSGAPSWKPRCARLVSRSRCLRPPTGAVSTSEQRSLADPWRRRWITPYPLTDNEIACYISHLRAMRHLLANPADRMLAVLEDDVSISPDLPAVLQAIEACGKSFDFIDLHRNFKHNEIFARCHALLPGYALGRVGYTHMRNLGYVVSKHGAESFWHVPDGSCTPLTSRCIATGRMDWTSTGWSARSSPLTR